MDGDSSAGGPLTTSLDGIGALFLDLDGTLYLGETLVPGVIGFLDRCRDRGIKRRFLSNNSSRSVAEYVQKLRRLGIDASEREVMLSTHDLLAWLSAQSTERVYLIGTAGMAAMLEEAGVEPRSEEPEYVVLGYDTEMTYSRLAKAFEHLHAGVPLIASHPDVVCPSPAGDLPDVGAFLAMIEASCGVQPVHVCGKPNAGMVMHGIDSMGLEPSACGMVGDRIYTDIIMAQSVGMRSILVLSGEAGEADVRSLKDGERPDLVVASVAELL